MKRLRSRLSEETALKISILAKKRKKGRIKIPLYVQDYQKSIFFNVISREDFKVLVFYFGGERLYLYHLSSKNVKRVVKNIKSKLNLDEIIFLLAHEIEDIKKITNIFNKI